MQYIVNSQIAVGALLRVDGDTGKLSFSIAGGTWTDIVGGKDYSQGDGITISGNTIAVDYNAVQRKLVQGDGITISGNTISANGISGNYEYEIPYYNEVTPEVANGVHQYCILEDDLRIYPPELDSESPDLYVQLFDCSNFDTVIESEYYPEGINAGKLPDMTVVHFFFDGSQVSHELRLPKLSDNANYSGVYVNPATSGSIAIMALNGQHQRINMTGSINISYALDSSNDSPDRPVLLEINNPDDYAIVLNGATVTSIGGFYITGFLIADVDDVRTVKTLPLTLVQ